MQHYFDLLKNRPQFRRLWLGQLISLTGDWFNTIALIILVNRYLGNSTLALSALFLARSLPVFFASPIGGVVADRFDRKQIMVWSNALRAIIVLGFLLVDSRETAWLIYALSILQFIVSSFFEPAYAAITPSLVTKEELLTANTLGSITWSAMLTFGSVIGGIVAGLAGAEIALVVDAATFALAALITASITPQFSPEEAPHASLNRYQELRDGMSYVREHPEITWVTFVKGLAQVGSVDVVVSVYAAKVFMLGEDGATTLGILFAAHGIGAVVGPLMGDWLGDGQEKTLKNWISIGFGFILLGWLVMGLAPNLVIAFLGMVLRGMGGSINWTYSSVILQLRVPDHFLGRVFGLDLAIFTLAYAFSNIFTGFIMDSLSISPQGAVVLISAGSLIPLGLWLLTLRAEPLTTLPEVAQD